MRNLPHTPDFCFCRDAYPIAVVRRKRGGGKTPPYKSPKAFPSGKGGPAGPEGVSPHVRLQQALRVEISPIPATFKVQVAFPAGLGGDAARGAQSVGGGYIIPNLDGGRT